MAEMKIPDKLAYTTREKIGEAVSFILTAAAVASCIVLFAVDTIGGMAVLYIVLSLIICGIFTLCSVYPQWTNIVSKPERCTDKCFHGIRTGCIVAKILFVLLLFICSLAAEI